MAWYVLFHSSSNLFRMERFRFRVSLQGFAYPGQRNGREREHLGPVQGEGVHAEDDSGLEQVA